MSDGTTRSAETADPQGAESKPSESLAWATVAVALTAAGGGAVIFLITDPDLHLDVDGIAVFAPVFFAAQAIERLLEPLATFYDPTAPQKEEVKLAREKKVRVEAALKSATATDPTVMLNPDHELVKAMSSATDNELEKIRVLRKKRANRKLLWFMLATVLGCILAGFLGLGILQAMATARLESYLGAIDVGLTGIVIGAGTKPIHDLIERVQKSKENADPATKPTEMLPGTPGAIAPG
jgi:hypothetical protein